ncbi:hypothetical protein, conserved [Leishmania lindenbergi]|uniref:Uncharacterized protein n=1 Tax=Leishmania lindenbergi TaxID=651832 RepID=A0AAW3AGU5_9TRYP
MTFFASPWARWAATVQRRCKVSPSSSSTTRSRAPSNFCVGTAESKPFQVKPNISVPVWKPSATYRKCKLACWLSNNLLAIAAYQLALEVGLTAIFGGLLYAHKITAQGVCEGLAAYHYPFVDWIDVEGGVYTEPVCVGPFTLNAQKMTALHTGHNIASGILPLQVLLLVMMLLPMQHASRLLRHTASTTVGASRAASGVGGGNAAAAAGATTAPPTSVSSGPRRASYARAASPKKPSATRPF